jgi:opacity protein-like surface antigen
MKKLMLSACAVLMLVAAADTAHAQLALRGGAGLIIDGTVFGGHASAILPFSSKSAGVMFAAEYYKKSGVTTVPVSARGLYRISVGEEASIYLGLGSGFIYLETEEGGVDLSSTKALFSSVVGLNKPLSGPLDFFAEVTLDRALSSDEDNNFAAKAGLALTLSE